MGSADTVATSRDRAFISDRLHRRIVSSDARSTISCAFKRSVMQQFSVALAIGPHQPIRQFVPSAVTTIGVLPPPATTFQNVEAVASVTNTFVPAIAAGNVATV